MSAILKLLSFFGIKEVSRDHFYLLCKNAKHSPTLYFKNYEKGVAEFTTTRAMAWRFNSSEEVRHARKLMGVWQRDTYIEEIQMVSSFILN